MATQNPSRVCGYVAPPRPGPDHRPTNGGHCGGDGSVLRFRALGAMTNWRGYNNVANCREGVVPGRAARGSTQRKAICGSLSGLFVSLPYKVADPRSLQIERAGLSTRPP